MYIVYELSSSLNDFDFALEDKYKYSGYGIGFYARGTFAFPDSSFGHNVIIFGADMSPSVHVYNKAKII